MLDDAGQDVKPEPQRRAANQRRHVPIAEGPGQLGQQQAHTAGHHEPAACVGGRVTEQVPRPRRADQPDGWGNEQATFLGAINQAHQNKGHDIDQYPHGHVAHARPRGMRAEPQPRCDALLIDAHAFSVVVEDSVTSQARR